MSESKQMVEIKTAKGKVYTFPKKFEVAAKVSVSKGIKAMLKDGYNPYQISKVTQIRYQMVRNILLSAGLWEGRND